MHLSDAAAMMLSLLVLGGSSAPPIHLQYLAYVCCVHVSSLQCCHDPVLLLPPWAIPASSTALLAAPGCGCIGGATHNRAAAAGSGQYE